MSLLPLVHCKSFIVNKLRRFAQWRLRNERESQRLEVLAQLSDDFLWKKALWTVAILGGAIAFIFLPIGLCLLGIFVAPKIMAILWILTKCFMALMLLIFALAIWSASSKAA